MQWLWEEYGIRIFKQTLSREVRALGYRKLSARPRHHEKSEAAVAVLDKPTQSVWRRSRRGEIDRCTVGICLAVEAWIGQKKEIIHHWARRGTRASAFCPAQGKTAGLVLPR